MVTKREANLFSLSQRVTLAVVPRLVWALVALIGWTWRFELVAAEGVEPVGYDDKPVRGIYCFWHQCVLPCAVYFKRSRATILISRSFDGELITRVLRLFGFDAARGSSSRGGGDGLLALKSVLERDKPVVFTADGPRGPIYKSKLGPVKLAAWSGHGIGVFHLHPERAWVVNSWDKFLVPKPFSRIVVSWGEWVDVPADTVDFEAKRVELDAHLEAARMAALERVQ